MNSAIFVVLVLLWGAECRPAVREGVLEGEDFLAFLMRSHARPRSMQLALLQRHPPRSQPQPPTTTTTDAGTTLTETETTATTPLVDTEPPQIVAVRVSSSVRRAADVRETSPVQAAATRSNFDVELTGYREKIEDSIAEASHDYSSRESPIDDKKPYAEALTFEESGLGYETRVSSETSQSRVYFRRPEPIDETVIIRTTQSRNYQVPIAVAPHHREERKYIPRYHSYHETHHSPQKDREYSTQSIVSQTSEERRFSPPNREQLDQQIISQNNQEVHFESQKLIQTKPMIRTEYRPHEEVVLSQQYVTPAGVNNVGVYQTLSGLSATEQHQEHEVHYQTPPSTTEGGYRLEQSTLSPGPSSQPVQSPTAATHPQSTEPGGGSSSVGQEGSREPRGQRQHYEQPEQNYEVDEAISLMTNGRAHGVQTERPHQQQASQLDNKKVGLVQEGDNYRKYRVEEKTPDGFIVGEYGVVSHDDGRVRGVRYTADGSISPRLIYDALVKFLSLR